ncbi:ABC transporter permease [Barnesiella viscericola]|uniref:ABC transporter permease n=1 Tax=Barnesiella viscericola TaxID=397865 RepID=UPI0025A31E89|nr:ABC transporter permease [Barnesiella viscericola]MDM8269311.1 ABC transporter permease [Barnesiella viscericola]
MSRLSRKIAWRYLFSKKSHSAINAISIVSVCGVAITTLALICTLSVYNGFTQLIGSLYSQIDPQIKITPREGKALDTEAPELKQIASWPEVAIVSPVIEENALCQYKDRQQPVLVKGVPDNYTQLSHIEELFSSGTFMLNDGRVDYVSLGIGIAAQLGIATNTPYPVELYAPNRLGRVNLANPSQSFNSRRFFVAGIFCSNQAIYDDQLVILPLATAREMFSYTTEATAIELRLAPGYTEHAVAQKLKEALGNSYRVATHIEQNDWYKWVQIEKWITFLILSFILMIATFNVIGALSMLIIDKKRDIDTLQKLGADDRLISRIFLAEGWLISAIGAGSGLILGVILCYLQQEYGLLKLGSTEGMFITDAYPVRLELFDTLAVTAIVLILGFVTAWYPAKFLRKRLLAEKSNRE